MLCIFLLPAVLLVALLIDVYKRQGYMSEIILSAGIDIGTTTTQVIFSRFTMEKQEDTVLPQKWK